MTAIELSTRINAPVQVCFDLSRSIDLHLGSMRHTGEKAVDGVTHGLIGPGEAVTWRARHFGLMLTLTSRITAFNAPFSFTDEQERGPFRQLKHQHIFKTINHHCTQMTDYLYTHRHWGYWADWRISYL